jgi:thymidine phosphorylase
VTATVPSIPLITASILSKKLAENLDALVLGVKFGAAAFMPTIDKANELARAMVELGIECGVNTRALVTNMDRPLGRAAGNWLEVKESVDCLEGKGPSDLEELVIAFAATLLLQTGKATHLKSARAQALECLQSGKPRKKWDEMIVAQGADLEAFNRKLAREHTAPVVMELNANQDGFLAKVNPRILGEVVRDLGGGRLTKETVINPDVGVDMILPAGEDVSFDTVLCRVHAADKAQAEAALSRLKDAFELSELQPTLPPLIQEVIQM